MQPISREDILKRIQRDNPWWADPSYVLPEAGYPRRVYFGPFKSLATDFGITRYGTLKRWAQLLGHTEAVALLDATLKEEGQTDKDLTALADAGANEMAKAG